MKEMKYWALFPCDAVCYVKGEMASVDEILTRYHTNLSYRAVFSWGVDIYVVQCGSNFLLRGCTHTTATQNWWSYGKEPNRCATWSPLRMMRLNPWSKRKYSVRQLCPAELAGIDLNLMVIQTLYIEKQTTHHMEHFKRQRSPDKAIMEGHRHPPVMLW